MDLIAIAAAAFHKGDKKSAGELVTAAFQSEDCEVAVKAMLDHNEVATSKGVDLESPGSDLRVHPKVSRQSKPNRVRKPARASFGDEVIEFGSDPKSVKASFFRSLKKPS